MEILNLSLPAANRFATDYMAGSPVLQSFFHYNYKDGASYEKRLAELGKRSFYRQEIAGHIERFMARYPTSEKVAKSIEKLKKPDSAVIIGGQQAGLLTGPLYSVHKVISIIKLAEQKEKELGVPVVPVFWIAGEDHDYQEVNHVYVLKDNKPEKWVYPEKVLDKKMVTDIPLNREACLSWVTSIFETFGETHHTNQLLDFAGRIISTSETFVDFFASIIMELFKDHGLLIVDSGNRDLRRLESEFFIKQINSFDRITRSVFAQQEKTEAAGYRKTIEINGDTANLFYYDETHQERILLHADPETGLFFGKNGEVQFTKEELLRIAEEYPERLSNNVVTRPLMQEWIFPTLAFIGGPGEIAYWSELQLVFENVGICMPPLVPRLNITILDRSIETDLSELGLDLKTAIASGTGQNELKYIESLKDRELEEYFQTAKEQLISQYQLIRSKTEQVDKGLLPLLAKNEAMLLKQIEFMEGKIDESVCRKHDHILNKFNRVENALRPAGSPQERIWNPFYYLNTYGLHFISDLLSLHYEFDGTHKVIKL
ncbi:bacillithiol biosynthesis cysteine-adding enzyme BshC [Bacillus sp. T33-2]|uniref:bacillithiol biosynthesis cysteine-adding enzyme BshC n=1 Tax=Bacillus sp. T33-2 TaxID=2054168 RepID=UPI000C758813|nr:bacillithiol biosynthesis cysteine-adding enzyme BshC [Bacillus sp. T33-2]PLR97387.1 bacillithiol biosynthesis cysteine-adding enzyme BshC [Bacillus sp. T33-2]